MPPAAPDTMAMETEHAAVGAPGATPVAAICCMCACAIEPNPTNMCLQCLRTQVNIATGLSTRVTMHQCRGCLKYMGGSGGSGWGHYEHESRELMAVCLKKVNGLNRLRLIDAQWIWTEPHSKRLKLKLTVQKEVMNGAVLQEAVVIEYVVRNQQCPDCQASYTTGAWKAIVQVRQRVDHKRTFLHLEQLILKHNAHAQALQIQSFKDGMDFYYAERNQAARFTEFLEAVCPLKVKQSKKLVGQDDHSNLFNFKYTTIVEIVPVCKDDLVVLPAKLAQNMGDIARLSLVQRVLNHLHLIDPLTGQGADLSVEKYHRYGQDFRALLSAGRLQEFMVLGAEPVLAPSKTSAPQRQAKAARHRLAEVEVALMADLGQNDTRYRTTTHLGHILRAGDTVLGYLLATASFNNEAAEELAGKLRAGLPDVVLVRKVYDGSRRRKKIGAWRLKKFEADEMEVVGARDAEQEERDYEEYRRQLEGDKEMRKNVNLYRVRRKNPPPGTPATGKGEAGGKGEEEDDGSSGGSEDEDGAEEDEDALQLDELLDDLDLDDADSPPDGEAAAAGGGADAVLLPAGAGAGEGGGGVQGAEGFAFTFKAPASGGGKKGVEDEFGADL